MPVDIAEIWRMLPHRYPFLLIDRVTEFESGKRVLGYKNVSANEAFFHGHFPDKPVMPTVLEIEGLAQAGGILTHLTSGGSAAGRLPYPGTIDNANPSPRVVPGDRLAPPAPTTPEHRQSTQTPDRKGR